MRRIFAAVLLAVAVPMPVAAQSAPPSTFRRCLNKQEVATERMIRHGIFLREGGRRCEEYNPGTARMWSDFDSRFGPRLAQQTDRRKKLFERQFKDDALKVRTYFDGRLVTFYRHYPLSVAFCGHVDQLLKELSRRGWTAFVAQSSSAQPDVIYDLKVCPQ